MNINAPFYDKKTKGLMLVFIDLQQTNICIEPELYCGKTAGCLRKIRSLLTLGRDRHLKIAHFSRTKPHTRLGNHESSFWIDGFYPRNNEPVYDRWLPSCFSNASFLSFVETVQFPHLVFAGFSGDTSCLSTAVESYHRGCSTTFIRDCSATHAFGQYSEAEAHNAVFDLISLYANVTTLDDFAFHLRANAL